MGSNINIASYNCRGLPKNFSKLHTRPEILKLFECSDIICFQETWLAKQELDLCNSLHSDFSAISVAKVDYRNGILVGRPHGGASIFYNRRFSDLITPIYFKNCDWCVALKLTCDSTCFILFNVYLPYESNANEDEYIEKLSMLDSFIQSVNHPSYAIVGDFNSNISSINGRINSKFGKLVIDFCEQNSTVLSSQIMLPIDSYTYISERWGTTSWLDLLISSTDFHRSVDNLKIIYDLSYNDHIPFCFNVRTSILPPISLCDDSSSNEYSNKKLNWKYLSADQIDLYTTFTDLFFTRLNIKDLVPVCNNPNCTNNEHFVKLDKAYNEIINCMIASSDKIKNVKRRENCKPPGKPGWTDYVKEKHNAAIEFYKLWRDNGKPRQGPFYENYRRSKLNYKYAIRAIKRNEDTIKADNVANKLGDKNFSGFWDSVRKFNRSKTVLPQQIGKAVGEKDICNQWKTHFHSIYNSVANSSDETFHNMKLNNNNMQNIDLLFTEAQFFIAISKQEKNKSTGYDRVAAEHIIYSSVSVLQMLYKIFNCFLMHGYLPSSFMSVVISPTFKKGGSAGDIDSYRPIALANCISKIFEALLRDKMIDYLQTSNNQFGYKQKLGTEMCLYAFKEIIDCYNKLDSNIYCCFLDASRAYDRVSHKTMFKMLLERAVPLLYIRILAYWYKHQNLFVKWGNCISTSFSVKNGVRQGSVLSPYLFCVYVDKISTSLNKAKIGCNVRISCLTIYFTLTIYAYFVPVVGICKNFSISASPLVLI